MKYSVKFPTLSVQKHFRKDLEDIPEHKTQGAIMRAVESLADAPRPFGEPKIKPPLIVYSLTAQYRVRIGVYRVLYDVDDKAKTVWILALRPPPLDFSGFLA